MLSAIHIRGLGPHRTTGLALDPRGTTHIVGPSAAGKTTTLDAISWCLYGCTASGRPLPEKLINDSCEELAVTVTTSKGTRFTRSRKRGVKGAQILVNDTRVTTQAEWNGKLGPLGDNPELLMTILFPMRWYALAEAGADGKALLTRDADGVGRPLRNLLASLLSVLDPSEERKVIGELMGSGCGDPDKAAELRVNDSIILDEAKNRRLETNRAHSELTGRHGAAVEQHARLHLQAQEPGGGVEQPSSARAQEARTVLTAAQAWEAWGPVLAWDERRAALGERPGGPEHEARITAARAVGELAASWEAWGRTVEWDERRAKIGGRPSAEEYEAKVAEKRAALDEAQAKVDGLRAEIVEAERPIPIAAAIVEARDAATRRLEEITREADGETACPHCARPWPDAVARIAAARTALPAAQTEAAAARKAYATAEIEGKRALQNRVSPLHVARSLAAGVLENAKNAHAAALKGDPAAKWDVAIAALGSRPDARAPEHPAPTPEAVAEAQRQERELGDAGGRWDAAVRALGARPTGTEPTGPAPTIEAIAQARVVERELTEAAGARRQLETQTRRAAEESERLAAEVLAADAEGKRLDLLVEAIRRAPSILAQRQAAALGLTKDGPLQIRFPSEGPAIEVLIDGRPFWTASRGRLVVADLAFRQALRKALGRRWLMLFTDNVQDYSGDLEAAVGGFDGPVVLLRTEAGDELRVVEPARAQGEGVAA